jgi:hypothetical protein
MATIKVDLPKDYVLLSASSIVVTDHTDTGISLFASTTTPTSDSVGHTVTDGESRIFPMPKDGEWYAKSFNGDGYLTFTEV